MFLAQHFCLMQSLAVSVLATCFRFNVLFIIRECISILNIDKYSWVPRNKGGGQSLAACNCAQDLICEMDTLRAGDKKTQQRTKCHGEKIDTKFAETANIAQYHILLNQNILIVQNNFIEIVK